MSKKKKCSKQNRCPMTENKRNLIQELFEEHDIRQLTTSKTR